MPASDESEKPGCDVVLNLTYGSLHLRRVGHSSLCVSSVLDPILYDLLDPAVRRSRSITKLYGKELQDFAYEGLLDQRLVNYLLDTLLSIVRFGGQGFAKVARTTQIRHSPHPGLIERAEVGKYIHRCYPCLTDYCSP
jgi:hypothetical protein